MSKTVDLAPCNDIPYEESFLTMYLMLFNKTCRDSKYHNLKFSDRVAATRLALVHRGYLSRKDYNKGPCVSQELLDSVN